VISPTPVKRRLGGQRSKAPWIASGRMGACICCERWKTPFLKGSTRWPSFVRVPSGETATERLHRLMMAATRSFIVAIDFLGSPRLMGTCPSARLIHPKMGTAKSTFLPTNFGARWPPHATKRIKGSRLEAWL